MKKNLLRTAKVNKKYFDDRTNRNNNAHTLNNPGDVVVKEYQHWKIIKNNYPYDAIAEVHDLLVPKRIFSVLSEASDEECTEYREILLSLEKEHQYEAMLINFTKNQSVSAHFHLHLLTWKEG